MDLTQQSYILSNIDAIDRGADEAGRKSIFRPFVVLALPGVNLFRRFSTYRRLPQTEPAPKDRLEKELNRLTNKIVSPNLFLTWW